MYVISDVRLRWLYVVGALILLLAGVVGLGFPDYTRAADPTAIVSDDFNSCELNQELWALVDPVGDAGLTFNGTQARLSVPAGVNHDVWAAGNRAPRLMQAAPDADFEIEVKFESPFDAQYQMQGILVEADANNFLRFDFYSNQGTRIFAAKFVDGSPTSFVSRRIAGMDTAPLYMRVKRVGNQWTQSYSLDGQKWKVVADGYTHALNVTKVGVFAGNAGASPAPHTAVVDYFFNTAAPITPEDGRRNLLNVSVSGEGTVTPTADPAGYPCGEEVTLSATAEPGWVFNGWSGDLTGNDNPATLKMDGDKLVTATFVTDNETDTTPPVTSISTLPEAPQPSGWYTGSTTVNLTGNEPGATYYQFDSIDLAGYTAGDSTAAPEGNHTIYAFSVDLAGNAESPPVSLNLKVDSSAPSAPGSLEATGTSATTVDLNWTPSSDDQSGVDYYVIFNALDDSTIATTTASSYTAEGLVPDTPYDFYIKTQNGAGTLSGASNIASATTAAPGTTPSGIVSDDFNSCELNQELWTLVDPVGDGGLTFNGTQARLSVPAGVNHDVWTAGNRAPRLMQAAPDTDFEIEVKFESPFDAQYQMQGILVEADPNNFLRFDFYSNQGTRIFAAKFVDGSPTSFVNKRIAGMGTEPLFMRVKRVGNQWTLSYSLDGQKWTVSADGYTHALNVTKVGVFAGNAGASPAPHTAVVDYFFNAAAPITPEDGRRNLLNVSVSGEGTVTPTADPAGYPCGEEVTLSATADPGWVFAGWSGDLTGNDNPATLKMDGDKSVTATFVTDNETDTTPPVTSISTVPEAPQPSGWYTGPTTVNLTGNEPGATYYQFDSTNLAGYAAGDSTTAPEGNHTIYAFSVDLAGNAESPPVSLNLKVDSSAPSAPGSLEATGTSATTVDLNWTPSSDDESGVDYYVIFNAADDSPLGITAASSYTAGGLIPDTPYDFYVKAQNGAGTLSGASNTASATTAAPPADSVPVIDVWHGENQRFGYLGNPQRWVNVLGNVSDSDGVGSLTYTLNGGAEKTLSIGPNGRRLASPGDFNIDIDRIDLVEGPNQVTITAVDGLGNRSAKTVVVDFAGQPVWPLPYNIDWSSTANIQDAAQVVDGEWAIGAGGLRTTAPGYDRLVAIGDVAWTDYEVTVPVTIHNVDYAAAGLGGSPGLGVLMRWQGHTDVPIHGQQPKAGWVPNGNIGWWRFYSPLDVRLEWYDPPASQPFIPALETKYLFKVRVQSTPGSGGLYSLKVWEADQTEPADWNVTVQEGSGDIAGGSLLLLANYVDATFGDVTVTPITAPAAYVLSMDTTGSGTIAVDPNQTSYSEGQTVTVTAQPESGWKFDGWSGDLTGTANPATLIMDGDKSVTATFAPNPVQSGIISDDFNGTTLNQELWTLVDPVGDAVLTLNGTQALLSVPAGVNHDVWTAGNRAPRLMQAAPDTDFEIEVKFESAFDAQYQLQGILVEADEGNFLRFDFYSNLGTRIFGAKFVDGSPTSFVNKQIAPMGTAPLYMRVKRVGNQWTLSYSLDGQSWTVAANGYSHTLTVTKVGVFAGNAGASPAAHTAVIDYFFNTASPIEPEDGLNLLNVNPAGSGTATQTVPATATPEPPIRSPQPGARASARGTRD